MLVTGGCGFIGVNFLKYLRERDYDMHLRVLDNLSTGKIADIKGLAAEFVEGDIRDSAIVEKALRGVDVVVHLAADTRVVESISNPQRNFEVNVIGTFNLLMRAREAGISKFVSASTGGAIIGEAEPPVHEEMVARPVSPYGASKLCCEAYLAAFGAAYGIKTCALRFSNVYGPWSYHKGSVVAQIFKRVIERNAIEIFGDGSQTRDYVFVKDVCAAIYLAATKDVQGVFQIGTGKPTTLNELISSMKEIVGESKFPKVIYRDFRAGEVRHTYGKVDWARERLGFAAQVSLKDGLAQTWEWFHDSHRVVV